MNNVEEIKEIIAEELGYWTQLHKAELDQEIKTKIHAAICELLMYAGTPEKITAEYLRERYRIKIKRTKEAILQNRENDLIARNRAVKSCEAIVRLGNKIKVIDEKTKR